MDDHTTFKVTIFFKYIGEEKQLKNFHRTVYVQGISYNCVEGLVWDWLHNSSLYDDENWDIEIHSQSVRLF